MLRTGLVTTLVLGFFAAGSVQADIVNVNFTYNGLQMEGPAAIGSAGDFWNKMWVSGGGPVDLDAAGGSPSGLTFSVSDTGGWYSSVGNGLMREYWMPNNDGYNDSHIFGGFDPDDVVDVYCYSGADGHSGNGARFECMNTGEIKRGTNSSRYDSYVEGENYVVFYDVTPDQDGEIVIRSTYSWYPVNGYQLDIVPEPVTLSVLALTGPVLLLRRCRRR